jgi:hypothetical protein
MRASLGALETVLPGFSWTPRETCTQQTRFPAALLIHPNNNALLLAELYTLNSNYACWPLICC